LHAAGAFGPQWSPAPAANAAAQALETQLAWYFHFYRQEVEQRRWYGFWDYGDVMHSYDGDRHVWRYDVGGYAWDNSELSTDLWLWYYFLRSGRQDVFRMAEAMTRHTGEVDVHHLGRFAPLGSRHNVRHWGDSAKQLRISTAANRRFLYYLTADERTGELLREQVEALRTLQRVLPGRKIGQQPAARAAL
ncbi:Tat pathway signal sequence domain protein, partial [Xanthomonas sp. Kuri4-2]